MKNKPSSYNRVKLERRVNIGIIYILNNEKYLKFLKKGFLKYIPEVFLPKFVPRTIEDIMIEGNIIGKIVGINLKPIDFNDEIQLKEYLNAVTKLKSEDSTNLFIEGSESLSKETIIQIEDITNMKIADGKEIRTSNVLPVMKNICRLSNEDLEDKEILIICDNKEMTKRIVKEISKEIKFVTTVGCEEDNDEIYEYILDETGISLFFPSNINRVLENYDIIINLVDNLDLDFSKVKRSCIIFDFGKGNFLENRRRPPCIKDFGFNLSDLGIDKIDFIGTKIRSDLLEALSEAKNKEIKYLYVEESYYSIRDYINSFVKLKVKGKL